MTKQDPRKKRWEFFQKAGEVVNARLASSEDGSSWGFGHVEFAGESDAQKIRRSLQDHFGSCGQISRVSIPKDYKTSTSKGIAYIDFKDQNSFSQALELNGSDLGGYTITVDEARPRADNCDSGWCRGRGSGKGRDGGGQGGGRFGGRRGGRDGGGRGCGGSRGRGPPNRQSVGTASIGKKKTFADD